MNSSQTSRNHNVKTQGEAYLNFYLNPLTSAVLSVKHTQEAIVVPGEIITPMPNMPACIMGLMSWRSRIIWTVDLSMILNLESAHYRSRQFNIIVIKVESILLGLVVHNVKGTIKFMPDDIRSPIGQVATSLVPYLRGCVVQTQEILLVLDARAIVQSSILRVD